MHVRSWQGIGMSAADYILLVEDDATIAEVVTAYLTRLATV